MPQDEKKSGVEALKAVLQEMVNQANLAADGITKAAEENIAVPLHDISKTAGAGKNLSDDPKKTIKAWTTIIIQSLKVVAFRAPRRRRRFSSISTEAYSRSSRRS
jgi:hypothetical protein